MSNMMGSMQSTPSPAAPLARHRLRPASGPPVLLASSGSDSGAAARNIAVLLAARRRAEHPALHQCAAGLRAHAIAGQATANDSGLIVMGLEPPVAGAHAAEDDTALLVVRRAATPVLAVTPELVRLPRRAIAAVDFSRASLHAARAALTVLDDGATLLLVNVQPNLGFIADDGSGCGTIYAQGVAAAFARLRQELDPPCGITVESVVLRGHALPELLALAERTNADLIAAGSRRQSADHHLAPGRVTTGLVRAARHSVLIAPA